MKPSEFLLQKQIIEKDVKDIYLGDDELLNNLEGNIKELDFKFIDKKEIIRKLNWILLPSESKKCLIRLINYRDKLKGRK